MAVMKRAAFGHASNATSGLIRKALLLASLVLLVPGASALAGGCVESVDKQIQFRDGTFLGPVERVVDFVAVIGERDLYNSNGARFTDFRAIIQQDRANLHKTGIADKFDAFKDQREAYFTTVERRRLLGTARYYNYCNMTDQGVSANRNAIVSGNVPGGVWVLIFRHPSGELAAMTSFVN
jgi:hypothetical protein